MIKVRIYTKEQLKHKRARGRVYAKTHRKEANERLKNWRKKNPFKASTYIVVRKALRNGVLVRPKICTKCHLSKKLHAHHPDYRKALHIVWLCLSGHRREHVNR